MACDPGTCARFRCRMETAVGLYARLEQLPLFEDVCPRGAERYKWFHPTSGSSARQRACAFPLRFVGRRVPSVIQKPGSDCAHCQPGGWSGRTAHNSRSKTGGRPFKAFPIRAKRGFSTHKRAGGDASEASGGGGAPLAKCC